MFTGEHCPKCQLAKQTLINEGLIDKVSIEPVEEIIDELRSFGIRSVPVFFDGENYITDFKLFLAKIKGGIK